MRRGKPIETLIPIHKDTNTTLEELSETELYPNFIHLDSMVFGGGAACLQCTFSAKNLEHARYIYDQLNIISPLMLALTASPLIKGKIGDYDVRWKMMGKSSECSN